MTTKLGGVSKNTPAKLEKNSPSTGLSSASKSAPESFSDRLSAVERDAERPVARKLEKPIAGARPEKRKVSTASGENQVTEFVVQPQQNSLTPVAKEPTPADGGPGELAQEPSEAISGSNGLANVSKPVEQDVSGAESETSGTQELMATGETPPTEKFSPVNNNFNVGAQPQAQVSVETAAEVPERGQQQPVQVRKQAMQDFMSRMQSEFGISPERIVEAFSRMDNAALAAPPEQSSKQFLANLEVPQTQQPRVSALYSQMLETTGEAALNEKLIGRESGLSMKVLSPRDEALRKLNASIDALNNSFAMRDSKVMVSPSAPMDSAMKAQMAAEQMNAELMRINQPGRQVEQKQNSKTDQAAADIFSLGGEESGSTASTAGLLSGGALLAGASASGSDLGMASEGGGGSKNWQAPSTQQPAAKVPDAGMFANPVSQFSVSPTNEAGKTSVRKVAEELSANASGAEATSFEPSGLAGVANLNAGVNSEASASAASAGPAGMFANRPVPTEQDEQANVKELINQTKIALKKGGGEIKMDLKPEGMGQIRLKVSVDNGQVNVQMLTDNDASKRLLEKGLHELKSDLAASQLRVDSMKVDVGHELSKHMDNSADQGREQTRQFASDVMSQMRDQRQAFQQGFMDNRGWRQYPRGQAEPEMGIDRASRTASAQAAGARAKRSDSGRLNLVA